MLGTRCQAVQKLVITSAAKEMCSGPDLIGKFTGQCTGADDRRFTAVTLSEPSLQQPATADPHFAQRSESAAAWVLEDFVDLDILDHSPAREGTVPVDQMGDPPLVIGNCWASINEIIEGYSSGYA